MLLCGCVVYFIIYLFPSQFVSMIVVRALGLHACLSMILDNYILDILEFMLNSRSSRFVVECV